MQRTLSEKIYESTCKVIPGGVNSPVRAFGNLGLSPIVLESGKGDQIVDVDGNSFIDYCNSWGAIILGHADEDVVKAASAQMANGSSFGTATRIECEIAEKIVGHIPSIEKIRFVTSGTEATMTAIRLARGYTGRAKIIKFIGNYHGHSDFLLVNAGSGVNFLNPLATSKGIHQSSIQDTICFPYNDIEAVRSFFRTNPLAKQVAAVILEPVGANLGIVPPEPGFLEMLREETANAGALLIFDEVVTGFRIGLTGAQGKYKITPDLTCFGKVIGGGFPVAALGGPEKILNHLAPLGEVYQAGTLSGNPVAMSAGLATLKKIEQPGFYERLEEKTNRLTKPVQDLLKNEDACLQQAGSMFTLFFGAKKVIAKQKMDEERFGEFFRFLFERGIYIPPSPVEAWFITSAHTDAHIDYTVDCIKKFFKTSSP